MTSTLDVAVKSDADNTGLVFDAFTDRIPKRNTPIRLVLTLTDEPPYGRDIKDAEADGAKEPPKHLTDPVPERVLQFLPPPKGK
ncbi:MAG: hypothetical protein MUF23_09790 [Pirellula sp.]|nr:hypothetical protein [Pirellula sp.]